MSRARGMTIRLKLTLWYAGLFFLAGVLLLTINYFLVRDSLNPAPERIRAEVAERYGIPREALEWRGVMGPPGHGMPRYVQVNGIPVPRLLDEAQRELRDEALRQLVVKSGIALALMTVLSFGLGWLLAGRMLRPIHAITATARRLSESTLHERLNLKGPRDELKELADTFDDMLARLDAAFTAQKEFVANASHELRTPLTIIRTEIDVALSDPDLSREDLLAMGTAVREAVERSEKLIDGLLVLARADSALSETNLDLAELAESQVQQTAAEADNLGLRLELDLQPAPVSGDRALLERMVGNLVENAIRHNVPGGWFRVATYTANQQAVLQVANSGPVVPPDEVNKLFARFYRPDKSRSRKTGGFGLGLSIVKSVVTAHHGTVQLSAPPTGG
ncbi:MAG: HAMP domain-containing protein, partial [Thermoleophilia bacterium]|nr:HAMP domain-containing protein [Thermoleophilia bacterium]